MNDFTHRKHPYHAKCVQWNSNNTDELMALLDGATLVNHSDGRQYIMIRHEQGIDMLEIGSWVVRGENNQVKVYDDKTFHVKYEKLGQV